MRTRFFLAAFAVAALGGCVVEQPGDVTILWDFSDGYACQPVGLEGLIDHMQVVVDGEVLDNGGRYDCNDHGSQGVTLTNFDPGFYTYEVDAIGFDGSVLYSGEGTFHVDGDTTTHVELDSNEQPGDVTILWDFSDGYACQPVDSERLIDHMHVVIDGEALDNGGRYDCNDHGSQGVTLTNFDPGFYTYEVDAIGFDGSVLYSGEGTFHIDGDTTTHITLASGSATLQLRWSFRNIDNHTYSCDGASITHVDVAIDGVDQGWFDCATGGTEGVDITGVAVGDHEIELQGADDTNAVFYTYSGTVTVGAPVTEADITLAAVE